MREIMQRGDSHYTVSSITSTIRWTRHVARMGEVRFEMLGAVVTVLWVSAPCSLTDS